MLLSNENVESVRVQQTKRVKGSKGEFSATINQPLKVRLRSEIPSGDVTAIDFSFARTDIFYASRRSKHESFSPLSPFFFADKISY